MRKGCICIAGKNSIAVSGLSYAIDNYSKEYDILALCDNHDNGVDTWQPSYKKFAKENKVKVVELEDLYEVDNLCFLSLEYFRLIDPLKFKTNRLINIHFSLLPAYRGMYTSAHPILNGEKTTGCTIHNIDKGIDTGEIISQISFKIEESYNCKDVYGSYLKYGQQLIFQTMDSLIEGNYQSIPQSSIGSSYYSKKSIDFSNLVIDTSKDSESLSRQLRAYTFRDYQLPEVNGQNIFGHLVTTTHSLKKPGTIISQNQSSMVISTSEFDVVLFVDQFKFLENAIKEKNSNLIKTILKSNPFLLDEKNNRGWTPLVISVFNGLNEITDLLLELGANPHVTNSKGTSPLMYAKDFAENKGDLHGLEALITFGAEKRQKDIFRRTIYDYLNKNSPFQENILALLS